jgi:hypothetical protein
MAELRGNSVVGGSLNVQGNIFLTGDAGLYNNFTSGYFGAGMGLWKDINGTHLEIDNIAVRNTLRTHIFQKDVVKAANGFLYLSDSAIIGKEDSSNLYCVQSKSATFANGTTIWYKDVDNNGNIYSVKGTVSAPTSVTLDGIIYDKYTVSFTEGAYANFKVGGTVVRTSGNTILLDASSALSPFIDFMENGTVKTRIGQLAGVVGTHGSITIPSSPGFGLYSENVYLTGTINATAGKIGNWIINGALYNGRTTYTDGTAGIYIGTDGINIGGTSTTFFQVNSSGGQLAGWGFTSTSLSKTWNESVGGGTITFSSATSADNKYANGTYGKGLSLGFDYSNGNAFNMWFGQVPERTYGSTGFMYGNRYGIAYRWYNGETLFEISDAYHASGYKNAFVGIIAGWNFDKDKLYNGTDIVLDAYYKKVSVNADSVKMYYSSSSDYGIKDSVGNFSLGSSNQISGWSFSTKRLFWNDGTYSLSIMSDSTSFSGYHAAKPAINIYDSSKDILINLGNIYKNNGNTGIAIFTSTGNNTKILEVSNGSGGSIAQIAGWNFDNSKIYSGKIYIGSGVSYIRVGSTDGTYANSAIALENDGSGKLANGNIMWDASGNVYFGHDVILSWKNQNAGKGNDLIADIWKVGDNVNTVNSQISSYGADNDAIIKETTPFGTVDYIWKLKYASTSNNWCSGMITSTKTSTNTANSYRFTFWFKAKSTRGRLYIGSTGTIGGDSNYYFWSSNLYLLSPNASGGETDNNPSGWYFVEAWVKGNTSSSTLTTKIYRMDGSVFYSTGAVVSLSAETSRGFRIGWYDTANTGTGTGSSDDYIYIYDPRVYIDNDTSMPSVSELMFSTTTITNNLISTTNVVAKNLKVQAANIQSLTAANITSGLLKSAGWSYTSDYNFAGSAFDLTNNKLYSSNAFLTGTIYANAGNMGGWTIQNGYLDSTNMQIYGGSNPYIQFYDQSNGTDYITLGCRLYDGNWHNDWNGMIFRANSQNWFQMYSSGDGVTRVAQIAGWDFNSNRLSKEANLFGDGYGGGIALATGTTHITNYAAQQNGWGTIDAGLSIGGNCAAGAWMIHIGKVRDRDSNGQTGGTTFSRNGIQCNVYGINGISNFVPVFEVSTTNGGGSNLIASIAGWNFDYQQLINGIETSGTGTFIRIRNGANIVGGNIYQSSVTKLKGFGMQWHQSSNAGYMNLGSILVDANGNPNRSGAGVNDWFGLQALYWDSDSPMFQLGFNMNLSGARAYKNIIAGWNFDQTALWCGTKGSDGAFTSGNGLTLGTNGTGGWISSKQFYIDSSGNAKFLGDLSGASGTFSGTISISGNYNSVYRQTLISEGHLSCNDSSTNITSHFLNTGIIFDDSNNANRGGGFRYISPDTFKIGFGPNAGYELFSTSPSGSKISALSATGAGFTMLSLTPTGSTFTEVSGTVMLSLTPSGSAFDAKTVNVINIKGPSSDYNRGIYFDGVAGITAHSAHDWLRLNQSNSFTSGVYTPGNFRLDGTLMFYSDTSLYRASSNVLRTDGGLIITYSGGDTTLQLTSTAANTGIKLGGDVNIYRPFANTLRTDNQLIITGYAPVTTMNWRRCLYLTSNGPTAIQMNSTTSGTNSLIIGNSGGALFIGLSTGDTTSATVAYKMTLDTSGNATFNGNVTSYTNPSDIRLKKDIVSFEPVLEKMDELKPVRFKYNDLWSKPDSDGFGFIAQEVEKVFPELVFDAKLLHNEMEVKAIYYEKLTPILVKAIQELKAEINELRTELRELKR